MPPIVLAIIPFIEAAIKFAPDATKIYEDARNLFAMWFRGGLITIEQQDRLRDWADNHETATLNGIVPPEFTVEANPD